MIKLTHANLKRPVYVMPAHVAAIYEGSDGSTHVILVGAIVPVTETPDEVNRLINVGNTTTMGMKPVGVTNGIERN